MIDESDDGTRRVSLSILPSKCQNRQLLENRFPVVSRDFDRKIKSGRVSVQVVILSCSCSSPVEYCTACSPYSTVPTLQISAL
jgi:hypothetical protein